MRLCLRCTAGPTLFFFALRLPGRYSPELDDGLGLARDFQPISF